MQTWLVVRVRVFHLDFAHVKQGNKKLSVSTEAINFLTTILIQQQNSC